MNEESGADYLAPWQLGSAVPGLGGVGKVLSSAHPDFRPGEIVMSGFFVWPWQLYFTIEAHKLMKVCLTRIEAVGLLLCSKWD